MSTISTDFHDSQIDYLNPPSPQDESEPVYLPYRIFMNQVHTYNARHISSYLADQMFGARNLAMMGEGGEGFGGEGGGKEPPPIATLNNYEIIGSSDMMVKTEDILYIVNENDENFVDEMMRCGVIIYDITHNEFEIGKALGTLKRIEDEFKKIQDIGPKTFDRFSDVKIFILISTVMTWGATKIPDDIRAKVIAEKFYKKRKAHPSFFRHLNCERDVMQKGKLYDTKLKTYVLGAGIVYGEEELELEYYFKHAWNYDTLQIFGNGSNYIPLINVKDLARILYELIEIPPASPDYFLAVEKDPLTLKEIVESISRTLGNNRTTMVDYREALHHRDITSQMYYKFTTSLKMVPTYVVKSMKIAWQSAKHLVANIDKIVQEFRQSRRLIPIKIILLGPPASGKTALGKKFCEYYGCHYVSVKSMVEELLDDMKGTFDGEKLYVMNEKTKGDLPDNYIVELLHKYLVRNLYQNQGYVLDDYPNTTEQAKLLFETTGEGQGDSNKILPDYVICLQATDEFLCNRMMHYPERQIQGTQQDEENMKKRLKEFRTFHTDEESVLDYFDELEIFPILLEVTDNFKRDFEHCIKFMIPPVLYGAILEQKRKQDAIEAMKREVEEMLLEEKLEKKQQQQMEAWMKQLERYQIEEEKLVTAQTEPLRAYLMKFVFPTLTKCLIELVKIKPDDPLDFLAESLFKENAEKVPFDPSFSMNGQEMLRNYEE